MPAKFGWHTFPRSSVILFYWMTEWPTERSHNPCLVGVSNKSIFDLYSALNRPEDEVNCRVVHIRLTHNTQSFARAPPRGLFKNLALDEAGTWPLPKQFKARLALATCKDWSRSPGNVMLSRDNVRLSMSRWNTEYSTPTAWYKSSGRSYDSTAWQQHWNINIYI